jgi:hypothetical protein
MRRLGVALMFVCIFCGGAFASNDFIGVGNWSDVDLWDDGHLPTVDEEVKIRGEETVCTLNISTGDWGVGQRMRVYEGATLLIEDGAELLGSGWTRVGASNIGTVQQTGGLVRLAEGKDTSKLQIGDSGGSEGSTYTISGGTITYLDGDGELTLGYRGGAGTLTVVGTSPTIAMNDLYVGGKAGSNAASGTLEFQIGADGVSPISLAGTAYLDQAGDDSTAALVLSLIDAPPAEQDILLIDVAAVEGVFDMVNGVAAPEGASVVLSHGGTDYLYTLTYANGVALEWVPEPATVVLLGLGSLIAIRCKK